MKRYLGKSIKYPLTFSTGKIGNLELENRLIKAPLSVKLGARDGSVTDHLIEHYRTQASGGVGLVIVEYAYVDHIASKSGIQQIGVADDEYIPGLSKLAKVIKDTGAKAALQITHCGRQKFLSYMQAKAPSRVPWEELHAAGAKPPVELSFEEIQELVEAFGNAALRAKHAGFDMVEVHGGNGYLITEFLSPRTNKRTDWYGGSLENRMRFLMEVAGNIRRKIGDDFPLSIKLSGTEYEPDGVFIEETVEVAKALERIGVDAIHVSGGNHHQTMHTISPMFVPRGNNVWAAEIIRKKINIPVIANGGINTPELIEEIIADGKADFVALGRPLYADPCLPNKMREGRPEDIAPCIRCNEGCVDKSRRAFQSVQCTVNPLLGMEFIRKVIPADIKRKVAIIGGGPSGMEAAIISTLRGHQVTIFERRKLGGVLLEASIPDFKAEIRRLISYFSTRIEKLGINVKYQEATPQSIIEGGFDAAIIAIGSELVYPDVPGIDNPIVSDALSVLRGQVKLGDNVIVIGAGLVGLEVALYLAEQGKKVTNIECQDDYLSNFERGTLAAMLERLEKCNHKVRTGRLLYLVKNNGAIIVDRFGKKEEILGDNIILATGFAPQTWFMEEILSKSDMPLFAIGDCVQPRKIFEAIHEGYGAGISV